MGRERTLAKGEPTAKPIPSATRLHAGPLPHEVT